MTDLKLDFSTLDASDLDGLAGLFGPMAKVERNTQAADWGESMVEAINAERACRESDCAPTPQTITLNIGDSELMFVAHLLSIATDEGSPALGDWGEAVLIAIAGELNRRGKQRQFN